MRCTNCQFHNMPGSSVCGRCGTSLGLARAANIDVHPPRAGAATLALRRVVPYRRWWNFLREETVQHQLDRFLRALRPERIGLPGHLTPDALMVRAIVPGWPQWYARQRWQGAVFFSLYATLMAWGLADMFRGGAGVWLGFAFAVHAASWVDVAVQSWPSDGVLMRFGRAIVTSLVLMLVVYGPPAWLIGRYAAPSRIGYTAGQTMIAGDVVLVSSAARPTVGDVVIFHGTFNTDRQEAGRHVIIRGFDGQLMDRVLAGPGDRVMCRGGALMVNGRIPTARWVNPTYRPADLALTVPADSFFILPSNVPDVLAGDRDRSGALAAMAVIPRSEVSGVAWLRIAPWSRRGRI